MPTLVVLDCPNEACRSYHHARNAMRHLMPVAIAASACLGIAVPDAVAQTVTDLVGNRLPASLQTAVQFNRLAQVRRASRYSTAVVASRSLSRAPIFRSSRPTTGCKARSRKTKQSYTEASLSRYIVDKRRHNYPAHRRRNVAELEPIRSELSPHLREASRHGLQFHHSAEEVNSVGNA
jgi:hypothetical protein